MTTSTLTDRYIWAVQRSLPERQRDDIDKELRGTIADTIDGQVEAGATPAAAEREVIAGLGDPYRLAAGYADRPLYLIGPKVFPDYIRLLKVLYAIVLPIVFAAILVGQLLATQGNIGAAFGATFGATISVAAHFGFWTTLVFALIERSPDYKATAWNPDTLPPVPVRGAIKLSDTIAGVVWYAIVAGAMIWAQVVSLYRADTGGSGAPIPVFDPALGLWQAYFLALPLIAIVLRIVLYRLRRWTWPLAAISFAGDLAFAVPVLWLLLNGRLLNPVFLAQLPDGVAPLFAPGGAVTIVAVLVFIAGAVGNIADTAVKTARASRER
ncbi:MAG TPA: permease prefix domain 1-containing protein [Pseudolysinimonas sp.]|jgi:hypothetical protein|nr:permease prefix domain 1-containing protein [Pseudolysinimonas sp.]